VSGEEQSRVKAYNSYPSVFVNINYFFEKLIAPLYILLTLLMVFIKIDAAPLYLMMILFCLIIALSIAVVVLMFENMGAYVGESEFYVKWFRKNVFVDEILSIKLLTREEKTVPLISVDPSGSISVLCLYAFLFATVLDIIFEYCGLGAYVLIGVLFISLVSLFLPARIGFRILISSAFALLGGGLGILFRDEFGSASLAVIVLTSIFWLIGFVGTFLIKPRSLTINIKAVIGGKIKTIQLQGKKEDILCLRDDLLRMMSDA